MQTIENQPFVYADIVYDETTKQFGYVIAVLQEDESYDVSPVRSGYSSVEEARHAASLEYAGKRAKQNAIRQVADWKVLIRWIAFSSSSYLLSALLLSILGWILFKDSLGQPFVIAPDGLRILFTMQFIVGMLVGSAQWLVLRQYFPKMSWAGWTITSGIGIFLGQFVGVLVRILVNVNPESTYALDVLRWVPAGICAQVVIGAMQWIVLKRYTDQAAWWILAAAASGVIIGLITGIMYQAIAIYELREIRYFYFGLFVTAIASCLGAIVTGLTLARLVLQRHLERVQ